MYFYTVTSFVTSVISANYWRKPRYDYRRNLDLFFSKLSFIIYFSNGIIYIYETKNIIDFTKINMILTLFGIIYCYYFSTKLYKLKNNNWWKYHILFHLFVTCEKMNILHLLSFRAMHIKKIEYY
jgi:predicted membrane channel-forming protein YqfA (hemolysin III family)